MTDLMGDFRRRISEGLRSRSLTSCSRWAEHYIHTPPPYEGKLCFKKFPWQREILNAMDPLVTVQKAAEMGFSVTGLIKSLYIVDEKRTDVLYVLPTQQLAWAFAKARLDQMVLMSPGLRGMFIGSNNVGLKTTASQAHIFIRGRSRNRAWCRYL